MKWGGKPGTWTSCVSSSDYTEGESLRTHLGAEGEKLLKAGQGRDYCVAEV